jgi:hypothetical protein
VQWREQKRGRKKDGGNEEGESWGNGEGENRGEIKIKDKRQKIMERS